MTSYQKHQKLLWKKTWEAYKRTGLNFEDLEAQSNLIYCEAVNSYKQNRASFSSHLWKRLEWGLIQYTTYEKFESKMEEVKIKESHYINPEERVIRKTGLECLSETGKTVIEFLKTGSGKKNIKTIRRYLRECGFTLQQIKYCFVELEKIVNSI